MVQRYEQKRRLQWYKRGAAYMHNSEAADPQEVPRNRPVLWALDAYSTGNECPLLVLSMPITWSLSAHLMVSD